MVCQNSFCLQRIFKQEETIAELTKQNSFCHQQLSKQEENIADLTKLLQQQCSAVEEANLDSNEIRQKYTDFRDSFLHNIDEFQGIYVYMFILNQNV